jgi:hypothetical protein
MAQTPVAVVPVTATPDSATVAAGGPLMSGPTTFHVSRPVASRGLSVYFGLLDAGVSLGDLQAALQRDDRSGGDSALGLVSIQGNVTFTGSETTRDMTFTLKPALTYVVVTEPETDNGPPPTRGFTTFTTSAVSSGAAAAAPDATIRMVDLRFRGDRVLPRQGVVRVENDGGVPHVAIAFALRRGVGSARLGRALRAGSQRAFGRVVAGAPVVIEGLLSGGGTANDQQVRFPRAGRYAIVCFFDDHQELGMYRIVSVR